MDTRWLEDFLALRETGNFTRAAERRYITQPAFSRRIRSLEDWLGVELIDRSTYPPRVNTLGERYAEQIEACLGQLSNLRADIRKEFSRQDSLLIATQASLSVSFCPRLVTLVRPAIADARIELIAGNLYECMEEFLGGRCDLLLCYDTASDNPMLNRGDLERLPLGSDTLLPVVASEYKSSLVSMDADQAIQVIGYPAPSFFGQLIQQATTEVTGLPLLHQPLQTAHADAVRALMLSGAGVAWLPSGLLSPYLASGEVEQVDQLPAIPLDIVMLRTRDNTNAAVLAAWEACEAAQPQH